MSRNGSAIPGRDHLSGRDGVLPGRSHRGWLDDARAGAIRAAGDAPDGARHGHRDHRAVDSSFADIAEQLNPAVVNIDATTRDGSRTRRRLDMVLPDSPDGFGRPSERDREGPRRGAGTGFIIDEAGYILTNHHVIETADRINVRLSDGRTLRAERIGSDPDTDIALIKVTSPRPLPHAPLGDSDSLRVG